MLNWLLHCTTDSLCGHLRTCMLGSYNSEGTKIMIIVSTPALSNEVVPSVLTGAHAPLVYFTVSQ